MSLNQSIAREWWKEVLDHDRGASEAEIADVHGLIESGGVL